MAKSKPGKKSSKKPKAKEAKAEKPVALPNSAPIAPLGQQLYDMPYSTPAPRLINADLGLHNLVARAGHNAGYDIDLTLLDAPDHRLIRSGVLLAHRVLDGRGEWYLGAPDWVPLLPKELIEPMGQGDLSEHLADLIRPFRRHAPLGPVAALRCERREFALRDDRGGTLALLRDDKVTVRRAGLTTARYREVMITPVGTGLAPEQASFLAACLGEAGATPVLKFPRLVRRLGAPATGPTDFPEPPPFDGAAPFDQFVAQLVAARLQSILRLDLELRAGGPPTSRTTLVATLSGLRHELGALAPLLDPAWADELDEELGWVVDILSGEPEGPATDRLPMLLRGERYLNLLDRLVAAARAAKVSVGVDLPAAEVLAGLVGSARDLAVHAADRLATESLVQPWDEAYAAFEQLAAADDVATLADTGLGGQRRRVDVMRSRLGAVQAQNRAAAAVLDSLDELSSSAAFDAGRQFERDREAGLAVRGEVLQRWSKARRKLVPA